MGNPREDVKDVVLGLPDRPTLKRQAETLKKYCLPDVKFFYLYFNTIGVKEMTVIYQVVQIVANYEGVKFEQISYDEGTSLVTIWTHVMIRPWLHGPIPLSIHTVLELEDVHEDRGKRARALKMTKTLRDYLEFSPVIRIIPVVGDIYANQHVRFLLGRIFSDSLLAVL